MRNLEQWDEFVQQRYAPGKTPDEFRDYRNTTPGVREFYRLNHLHQTRDFVLAKKREFGARNRMKMSIWSALEYLNTLVDESDPDTDLSQIDHNLQAAEAIRRDGHPGWFQLVGLVHDLGKVLCLWGEPQWAVVGDTFPTGCAYSDKVVFPEFFAENPDAKNPAYQTPLGIYQKNGGLNQVDMSWGHDEYFYQVARDYLPEPALYMIRYHSFYSGHREGAYDHLMSDHDREMFEWVKKFSPYDLYSKSEQRPSASALRPHYQALIDQYFPKEVAF